MIEYQEGFHTYYVYILTNKAKTVLYTGVTNNLKIPLQQHIESLTEFVYRQITFIFVVFQEKIYVTYNYEIAKRLKGWKKKDEKLDEAAREKNA
jgi:putative endonuclease